MRTEIFLAARYIFRGKIRHLSFISMVSCLGVMLGVATLIVVISVMNGFDRDLTDKLLRFNYHINIESENREIPLEVIEKVKNTEGVESATLFLQTQIFGKINNHIFPLVVKGIDFEDAAEREIFSRYILEDDAGRDGFYVGVGLANRFFLEDKISYYPLDKKLRLKDSPIKGVFKFGLYDIDNNYLITGIKEAKALSDNYLLFLGVRVKDPFKVTRIKEALQPLEKKGFFINTWMETNQVLFSALKLEKITMFIILSLIVVVAVFNIFATITVKVVEKTKDIGILKSLGFSSRKILSLFSVQGIILGVMGVFSGTGLGIILCLLLEKYQFIKIPQEIYYIERLPVALNIKDILLIAFLGVLLSFIASLLPALRASRLKPCEALRYE